jgi:hypothetical protein
VDRFVDPFTASEGFLNQPSAFSQFLLPLNSSTQHKKLKAES